MFTEPGLACPQGRVPQKVPLLLTQLEVDIHPLKALHGLMYSMGHTYTKVNSLRYIHYGTTQLHYGTHILGQPAGSCG